jgi:hypothetical protein
MLVIASEHKLDTLLTVLESAQRQQLEEEPARLAARCETASVYEIATQRVTKDKPSF